MLERAIRVPSDAHPILVERSAKHVVVRASGEVIADTSRALMLREAGNAAVLYIPRRDVAFDVLEASETTTYCPYKGEARHFDLGEGDHRLSDVCWSYEAPHWAVAEIEDHIAFDPERIDRIELA